jgi:MFS family permease
MSISTAAPDAGAQARRLALLVFLQMLPATLLTPAIRPLFAELHGGHEGAMHAFMALNMLGGLLAAPWLGRLADRSARPRRWLGWLCLLDALLLLLVAAPLATPVVLGLRLLEGAAHVGAATLLLGEAAALRRALGQDRVMGLAGGALMLAIALGSALGGLTVGLDARAPFVFGALLAAVVGWHALLSSAPAVARERPEPAPETLPARALAVPVAAAFVERFSVGCIVVTFGLFAHRVHLLPDAAVGYLFSLLTLPFALLMYPVGRLSERVPRALLMGGGALLYAAALFGLGQVSTAVLPAMMLLAGVASALLFAPTLAYAAAAAGPTQRARAMAAVNAAGCLGMLLGPTVAGPLCAVFGRAGQQAFGYRVVFAVAAASVVAWALACLPWLLRQWRRERVALPAGLPHGLSYALSPAVRTRR